jgi:hypothetical protein
MIQRISDDLLWSQIVAKAWCDEGVMKRLRSNPRDVLSEHGLEVPEDMEVRIAEGTEVKVEEDERVRHFILPVSPPDDLTDEDLIGHTVSWCGWCGGCACRCRC